MGTQAKVIRKPKRRIRYELLAFIFCLCCGLFYTWAMIFQKNINYHIALEAQDIQMQVADKKEEITYLQGQIYNLSNRDRILSMVAKDGIKSNQDQVVILIDTE